MSGDVSEPLLQAPLLQQLAFQEVAAVAGPGAPAARRADVWSDDSGATWRALAQPCLAQVLWPDSLAASAAPAGVGSKS